MSIHFITSGISELSGGPSWAVVNLAKQFAKRGFSVRISSFGNLESSRNELKILEAQLDALEIKLDCYFARLLNKYGFVNPTLILKIMFNRAQNEKFILNYVYSFPILYFAIFCRCNSEVFLIPHGSLSRNEFRKYPIIKILYALILLLTNVRNRFHFVFATRYERNNSLFSKAPKQSIIGFGIDNEIRGSISSTVKNRLLFLGRIAAIKNLESLLIALNILSSKGIVCFLEIIGEGKENYVASLKNLTKELNLNGVVSFSGWLSGIEKEQVLNRSNVLILPSHSENFGIVVLEAAVKGIPCVLSPSVGIAENVALSRAGVVARSTSPNDLSDAIIEILENLGEYAENAYSWSRTNSWDSISQLWENLFQESK